MKHAAVALPIRTGCSRRPFTRLQRIPLSRAPFQGQSSRPTASLPTSRFDDPFGPSLCHRLPGLRRVSATSSLLARCRFHDQPGPPLPRLPLPFRTFASFRIKAFCRLCCKLARLPKLPDSRSLPATVSITSFRLRINVPESLPLRRLAVPQTSWNLSQYAPDPGFRQCLADAKRLFFINFFPLCFEWVTGGKWWISCG